MRSGVFDIQTIKPRVTKVADQAASRFIDGTSFVVGLGEFNTINLKNQTDVGVLEEIPIVTCRLTEQLQVDVIPEGGVE